MKDKFQVHYGNIEETKHLVINMTQPIKHINNNIWKGKVIIHVKESGPTNAYMNLRKQKRLYMSS